MKKFAMLFFCMMFLMVLGFSGDVFAEKSIQAVKGNVSVKNLSNPGEKEVLEPNIHVGYGMWGGVFNLHPYADNLGKNAVMSVFLDGVLQGRVAPQKYRFKKGVVGLVDHHRVDTQLLPIDQPGQYEVEVRVRVGKKKLFSSVFDINVPIFETWIGQTGYDDVRDVYRLEIVVNTIGNFVSKGDVPVLHHPDFGEFSGSSLFVPDPYNPNYLVSILELSKEDFEMIQPYDNGWVKISAKDGNTYENIIWLYLYYMSIGEGGGGKG